MARVTFREDRAAWYVEWKEAVVSEQGAKRWRKRSRRMPSKRAADALAREVETAKALGERWEPAEDRAVVTMQELVVRYLQAGAAGGAKATTIRSRASYLAPFLTRHGDDLADRLSVALLQGYAGTLPAEGRQAETRYRKVLEVELAWRWAWDSELPGVPPPRRITSQRGGLQRPPPVVATAAPTWDDVDAMLAQLTRPWHRRAGLVIRYHGLRASQATGLRWADLDLERGLLRLPSGRRGAKRGRGRVVPLAPPLLVEVRRWEGQRRGELLFPRRYTNKATGQPHEGPYRGDALLGPFRRAWTLAEVPADRWGAPEASERAHGRPVHALRSALKVGLLRLGVDGAVVDYLLGHSRGATDAAYVPQEAPEQSPLWAPMVEAVARIPPHPAFA